LRKCVNFERLIYSLCGQKVDLPNTVHLTAMTPDSLKFYFTHPKYPFRYNLEIVVEETVKVKFEGMGSIINPIELSGDEITAALENCDILQILALANTKLNLDLTNHLLIV
jgi:hypothetical protein